jgi:hypothetical protein
LNYIIKFIIVIVLSSDFDFVGLIMGTYIQEWKNFASSASELKLSQVLSMYYSEDGVFTPENRACQRRDLYPKVAPNTIMEEQVRELFWASCKEEYFQEKRKKIGGKNLDLKELENWRKLHNEGLHHFYIHLVLFWITTHGKKIWAVRIYQA